MNALQAETVEFLPLPRGRSEGRDAHVSSPVYGSRIYVEVPPANASDEEPTILLSDASRAVDIDTARVLGPLGPLLNVGYAGALQDAFLMLGRKDASRRGEPFDFAPGKDYVAHVPFRVTRDVDPRSTGGNRPAVRDTDPRSTGPTRR